MAKSLKNLSEGLHFEMKLQEGEFTTLPENLI